MEFLPESKKFKILGLSNATFIPSGYGVQSKGMFYDWLNHYDVRILCNYGIQGAWMNINGLIHYPTVLGDTNGDATAEIIFKKWRPDIFITLYDIWMGAFIKKNTPLGMPIQPIHPHWIPICVSGDTEVIGTSDSVLTSNGLAEVTSTQVMPTFTDVYEIKTETGRHLTITADNPVWTNRGWKLTRNLNKGDMVHTIYGNPYDVCNRERGLGISSWINRWRRNNHNTQSQAKIERLPFSSNAKNRDNKPLPQSDESPQDSMGRAVKRTQIQSGLDYKKSWLLLPNNLGRKPQSKTNLEGNHQISHNQMGTCENNLRLHRVENQQDKRIQCSTGSKGFVLYDKDKIDECQSWERITRKSRRTDEVKAVYDLSTTSHNFYANGILIHNCMVDHDPIPEATLMQAAAAYKVVTPTRFGEAEFKRFNVPVEYIPFGIDTNLFSPSVDKVADKEWLNKHSIPFVPENEATITGDDFVIIMVGANKDPYRKGFMRAFIALQLFFDRNPDARKDVKVYLHSWMKHSRDIPHGAKTLHVEQYCRGTDDYSMVCSASEADMSRIFKAADLLIHPSQGGGFEIPILEALSCGVAVAGSDFVGMKELIEGHGWLIPPIRGEGGSKSVYFSPLDATQIIVDEVKLSYAIEEAYNGDDKRRMYGEAGRKFAEGFDWSLVNPMWHRLFEDIRGEWHTSPLEDRRL